MASRNSEDFHIFCIQCLGVLKGFETNSHPRHNYVTSLNAPLCPRVGNVMCPNELKTFYCTRIAYIFNFYGLDKVDPVSANRWLDMSAENELSGSGQVVYLQQ